MIVGLTVGIFVGIVEGSIDGVEVGLIVLGYAVVGYIVGSNDLTTVGI